MKVPRILTRDQVPKEIIIPNPGLQEGEVSREYVVKSHINGFREQTFTSYDYPKEIPGIFLHYEEDPGNGEMHPVYLTVCMSKNLYLWGREGWFNGPGQMDEIPRVLLSQPGLAVVRSVKEFELRYLDKKPEGKIWMPSITFANGARTEFMIRYLEGQKINTCTLYTSDGKDAGTDCAILTTVTLDIDVTFEKEGPKAAWPCR